MEEEYSERINRDRVQRNVICINPTHDTVIIFTDKKLPKCPLCENLMVALVKSVLTDELADKSNQ